MVTYNLTASCLSDRLSSLLNQPVSCNLSKKIGIYMYVYGVCMHIILTTAVATDLN